MNKPFMEAVKAQMNKASFGIYIAVEQLEGDNVEISVLSDMTDPDAINIILESVTEARLEGGTVNE